MLAANYYDADCIYWPMFFKNWSVTIMLDRHQDHPEGRCDERISGEVPPARDTRLAASPPSERSHPPPASGDAASGLLHVGVGAQWRPPGLHQHQQVPAGAASSVRNEGDLLGDCPLPRQGYRAQRPQVREHNAHQKHGHQNRRQVYHNITRYIWGYIVWMWR